MENEEVKDLAVVEESKVMNLSDYRKASNTQVGTFSNIHDSKELFNLSSHVDFKLNDVVGEKIRVKKVLVRKFEKPLDEPIVNEETGEIKSYEYKVSCVLVDDNGKSYATGSKIFANLLMMLRYREQWLLWIIIDTITVVMWILANDLIMVTMWSVYLVNAFYGYYNWSKISKER